jgi:hypothetical protein
VDNWFHLSWDLSDGETMTKRAGTCSIKIL